MINQNCLKILKNTKKFSKSHYRNVGTSNKKSTKGRLYEINIIKRVYIFIRFHN